MRAYVLMIRDTNKAIKGTASQLDQFAFSLSAFNGGAGGLSNALRLCTIEEAKAIIHVVKESSGAGEKELGDIQKTLEHIRDSFNEAFDESKIDVELPEGHMGDPEEIRKAKLKYQSELFTTKKMCLTFALQLYTQTFRYKNTMNSHLLEWANKSLTIWSGLLS